VLIWNKREIDGFFMSRQFRIVLEYAGENPIRNTFLCKIDELECSILRDWEDLHNFEYLYKSSGKKHSIKTLELLGDFRACFSWGIEGIAKKIEMVKKEIELDTELDEDGKIKLSEVVCDLQKLHDIALERCNESNIEPEKCYINWWIDC
jgi:hypothetical protein